ncbi:membrane protein [Pseudorhizobium endolithicum]|uniref:Membrane protein n=1 Tax=Pseudorhizobium endolithicum TaxID=1191678 RepID=A0ABM8PMC3_9HYPH|nr:ornithine cyclodeaminase family protein [Pseudorhizobium endolithicum]CAD7037779.1 membrane protein [Pseudorhizobium endolithicum]
MLYLSDQNVRDLLPDPSGLLAIIGDTLTALADGRVQMPPRTTLASENAARFIAFPVRMSHLGVAGVKWFGIDHQPESSTKTAAAHILLSSEKRATPLAVVEAGWITAWRTAMMSLYAAKLLAQPQARRIAFIACGEQARLHLDAFQTSFPLAEVRAWSRSGDTAKQFVKLAVESGLAAEAVSSARTCVEGADIIIASSPAAINTCFTPGDLAPGAFVSLVDLGRSFTHEALTIRDVVHVDDVPQARALMTRGDIATMGMARMLSITETAPSYPQTRPRIFLPTGLGAVDVALAHYLWREAVIKGRGHDLR